MSNTPLKGFLAAEDDREVRVDVRDGTWIIPRSDIESLSEWENAPAAAHAHKPVQVVIKPGSKIGFLRMMTVHPLERPFTLPEHYSKLIGNRDLSEMAQQWGLRQGFKVVEPLGFGPHDTVSCWEDPSGWGLVCQGDDCGPPEVLE